VTTPELHALYKNNWAIFVGMLNFNQKMWNRRGWPWRPW